MQNIERGRVKAAGDPAMKAKVQELLGLLTMVVERVRAANDGMERAEDRAARMSLLLDALTNENESLRADLDQADSTAVEARNTIRSLRAQIEAGGRLAEALEARAAEAELRIYRVVDALGLSMSADMSVPTDGVPRPSAALH